MQRQPRKFESAPAVREQVPLLLGIVGPSGSGKTWSALRLATGIQRVVGGQIFGIDTEAKRMLHYSDYFKFRHVPFNAPFGSLDYLDALADCVNQGAKVVIVDQMSSEHDGPGGMVDAQDKELDRLAGNDWQKRERCKMLAWVKPKQDRQKLINGMLQLNCNFIFLFRAKSVSKPVKDSKGKTEVVPQGFVPIAGEAFVFEMTTNILLLPNSKGIPTWHSENPGETMAMKQPQQFREIFAEPQPLSEKIGEQLALWARGDPVSTPKPTAPQQQPVGHPTPAYVELDGLLSEARYPADIDEWKVRANELRSELAKGEGDRLRARMKAVVDALDSTTATTAGQSLYGADGNLPD